MVRVFRKQAFMVATPTFIVMLHRIHRFGELTV